MQASVHALDGRQRGRGPGVHLDRQPRGASPHSQTAQSGLLRLFRLLHVVHVGCVFNHQLSQFVITIHLIVEDCRRFVESIDSLASVVSQLCNIQVDGIANVCYLLFGSNLKRFLVKNQINDYVSDKACLSEC